MNKETNYMELIKLFARSMLISVVGMIFPFIYIFFPSMFVVEAVKKGILKVMATLVLVVLLIGAIFGPLQAIIVFTIFGPLILIFHYMITTNKSISQTIMATSIIFFISIIVLMLSFGIDSNVLNSQDTINSITAFYGNIAREAGLSESDIITFTQSAEFLYKRFLQIMPSVMIIVSVVVSYFTYTVAGRTLLASGKFIKQPSSLEFLRIPREVVFLSIATFAITYLLRDYIGEWIGIFNINLLNIIYFLLFANGIGFLKFLMTRYGVKRFLQFIFIGLSLAISSLQLLVIIIGGIDALLNFRKINWGILWRKIINIVTFYPILFLQF